jgi:hypothetical protein
VDMLAPEVQVYIPNNLFVELSSTIEWIVTPPPKKKWNPVSKGAAKMPYSIYLSFSPSRVLCAVQFFTTLQSICIFWPIEQSILNLNIFKLCSTTEQIAALVNPTDISEFCVACIIRQSWGTTQNRINPIFLLCVGYDTRQSVGLCK